YCTGDGAPSLRMRDQGIVLRPEVQDFHDLGEDGGESPIDRIQRIARTVVRSSQNGLGTENRDRQNDHSSDLLDGTTHNTLLESRGMELGGRPLLRSDWGGDFPTLNFQVSLVKEPRKPATTEAERTADSAAQATARCSCERT